jgi:hypothetical protein
MRLRNDGARPRFPRGAATALLCIAGLALVIVASGCEVVSGSGTMVTTPVHATGFTRVKASDGWDVHVVQGDSYDVAVTTDDNVVDYLDVATEGKTLVLRLKPMITFTRVTVRATVVMPVLEGLSLSDDSSGSVAGFSSDGPLALAIQDSSSAKLDALKVGTLDVRAADDSSVSGSMQADRTSLKISDASDADLSGATRALALRVSDGSSAKLGHLRAGDADVRLSDGSDGVVMAEGTLDARLSDGSHLKYVGSPKLGSVSTSDGSSLTRIEGQAE